MCVCRRLCTIACGQLAPSSKVGAPFVMGRPFFRSQCRRPALPMDVADMCGRRRDSACYWRISMAVRTATSPTCGAQIHGTKWPGNRLRKIGCPAFGVGTDFPRWRQLTENILKDNGLFFYLPRHHASANMHANSGCAFSYRAAHPLSGYVDFVFLRSYTG